MNNDEWEESLQDEFNTFRGILALNQKFQKGGKERISYRFDCSEFEILRYKFNLSQIAGKGSAFERAKRLTHYLAPRLTHKGDFDEQIDCNAIDLLGYALNKPEHGINCVNKSKILQECCLALGIYARRVWLMPCSPFDSDNHVVTEIYDFTMQKWAMLDVTADGYFTDGSGLPLSVLEIRDKLGNNAVCDFVQTAPEVGLHPHFPNRETEKLYYRRYFAKNLFWLAAEKDNAFGTDGKRLIFVPGHFRINAWLRLNSAMRNEESAGAAANLHISGISALAEIPNFDY